MRSVVVDKSRAIAKGKKPDKQWNDRLKLQLRMNLLRDESHSSERDVIQLLHKVFACSTSVFDKRVASSYANRTWERSSRV